MQEHARKQTSCYSCDFPKGRLTASLLIMSLLLTFLLSLNFHLWSDGWQEGDLEDWVRQQGDLVGTGITSEEVTARRPSDVRTKNLPIPNPLGLLPSPFSLPGIALFPDVFFAPFFSAFLPRATLCSLSVRMNR